MRPLHAGSLCRGPASRFAGVLLVLLLIAPPAEAAFHHIEITKVMLGYNGDTDVQAVELKLLSAGEIFVSGTSVVVYDANGVQGATLGTFTSSVTNGLVGDNILCATLKFSQTFGITPDLQISPGLLTPNGQAIFRSATCLVNGVPYGEISAPVGSSAAAPAPWTHLAYALVRTADAPTVPSCPLSDNAAVRFEVRSGSEASPITFRNNARQTVNVFSQVTAVTERPPGDRAIRIYPNPAREEVRFEAGSPIHPRVRLFDAQGRLVRDWVLGRGVGSLRWDGTSVAGSRAPSGWYYFAWRDDRGPTSRRFLLLR